MKAPRTRMLLALVVLALVASFAVAELAAQGPPRGVGVLQAEPNLLVNGVDGWYGPVITVAGLDPGGFGQQRIAVTVENGAGNVTLRLENLVDSGNETTEPEWAAEWVLQGGAIGDVEDWGWLSQYLDVTIWLDDGSSTLIASGKLQSLVGTDYDLGTWAEDQTTDVVIDWSLPAIAGNEVHEDKSTFDIFFGIPEVVP